MLGTADRGFVLIQPGDGDADGWYSDNAADDLGWVAGFGAAAGFTPHLSRGDSGGCVLPPGL